MSSSGKIERIAKAKSKKLQGKTKVEPKVSPLTLDSKSSVRIAIPKNATDIVFNTRMNQFSLKTQTRDSFKSVEEKNGKLIFNFSFPDKLKASIPKMSIDVSYKVGGKDVMLKYKLHLPQPKVAPPDAKSIAAAQKQVVSKKIDTNLTYTQKQKAFEVKEQGVFRQYSITPLEKELLHGLGQGKYFMVYQSGGDQLMVFNGTRVPEDINPGQPGFKGNVYKVSKQFSNALKLLNVVRNGQLIPLKSVEVSFVTQEDYLLTIAGVQLEEPLKPLKDSRKKEYALVELIVDKVPKEEKQIVRKKLFKLMDGGLIYFKSGTGEVFSSSLDEFSTNTECIQAYRNNGGKIPTHSYMREKSIKPITKSDKALFKAVASLYQEYIGVKSGKFDVNPVNILLGENNITYADYLKRSEVIIPGGVLHTLVNNLEEYRGQYKMSAGLNINGKVGSLIAEAKKGNSFLLDGIDQEQPIDDIALRKELSQTLYIGKSLDAKALNRNPNIKQFLRNIVLQFGIDGDDSELLIYLISNSDHKRLFLSDFDRLINLYEKKVQKYGSDPDKSFLEEELNLNDPSIVALYKARLLSIVSAELHDRTDEEKMKALKGYFAVRLGLKTFNIENSRWKEGIKEDPTIIFIDSLKDLQAIVTPKDVKTKVVRTVGIPFNNLNGDQLKELKELKELEELEELSHSQLKRLKKLKELNRLKKFQFFNKLDQYLEDKTVAAIDSIQLPASYLDDIKDVNGKVPATLEEKIVIANSSFKKKYGDKVNTDQISYNAVAPVVYFQNTRGFFSPKVHNQIGVEEITQATLDEKILDYSTYVHETNELQALGLGRMLMINGISDPKLNTKLWGEIEQRIKELYTSIPDGVIDPKFNKLLEEVYDKFLKSEKEPKPDLETFKDSVNEILGKKVLVSKYNNLATQNLQLTNEEKADLILLAKNPVRLAGPYVMPSFKKDDNSSNQIVVNIDSQQGVRLQTREFLSYIVSEKSLIEYVSDESGGPGKLKLNGLPTDLPENIQDLYKNEAVKKETTEALAAFLRDFQIGTVSEDGGVVLEGSKSVDLIAGQKTLKKIHLTINSYLYQKKIKVFQTNAAKIGVLPSAKEIQDLKNRVLSDSINKEFIFRLSQAFKSNEEAMSVISSYLKKDLSISYHDLLSDKKYDALRRIMLLFFKQIKEGNIFDMSFGPYTVAYMQEKVLGISPFSGGIFQKEIDSSGFLKQFVQVFGADNQKADNPNTIFLEAFDDKLLKKFVEQNAWVADWVPEGQEFNKQYVLQLMKIVSEDEKFSIINDNPGESWQATVVREVLKSLFSSTAFSEEIEDNKFTLTFRYKFGIASSDKISGADIKNAFQAYEDELKGDFKTNKEAWHAFTQIFRGEIDELMLLIEDDSFYLYNLEQPGDSDQAQKVASIVRALAILIEYVEKQNFMSSRHFDINANLDVVADIDQMHTILNLNQDILKLSPDDKKRKEFIKTKFAELQKDDSQGITVASQHIDNTRIKVNDMFAKGPSSISSAYEVTNYQKFVQLITPGKSMIASGKSEDERFDGIVTDCWKRFFGGIGETLTMLAHGAARQVDKLGIFNYKSEAEKMAMQYADSGIFDSMTDMFPFGMYRIMLKEQLDRIQSGDPNVTGLIFESIGYLVTIGMLSKLIQWGGNKLVFNGYEMFWSQGRWVYQKFNPSQYEDDKKKNGVSSNLGQGYIFLPSGEELKRSRQNLFWHANNIVRKLQVEYGTRVLLVSNPHLKSMMDNKKTRKQFEKMARKVGQTVLQRQNYRKEGFRWLGGAGNIAIRGLKALQIKKGMGYAYGGTIGLVGRKMGWTNKTASDYARAFSEYSLDYLENITQEENSRREYSKDAVKSKMQKIAREKAYLDSVKQEMILDPAIREQHLGKRWEWEKNRFGVNFSRIPMGILAFFHKYGAVKLKDIVAAKAEGVTGFLNLSGEKLMDKAEKKPGFIAKKWQKDTQDLEKVMKDSKKRGVAKFRARTDLIAMGIVQTVFGLARYSLMTRLFTGMLVVKTSELQAVGLVYKNPNEYEIKDSPVPVFVTGKDPKQIAGPKKWQRRTIGTDENGKKAPVVTEYQEVTVYDEKRKLTRTLYVNVDYNGMLAGDVKDSTKGLIDFQLEYASLVNKSIEELVKINGNNFSKNVSGIPQITINGKKYPIERIIIDERQEQAVRVIALGEKSLQPKFALVINRGGQRTITKSQFDGLQPKDPKGQNISDEKWEKVWEELKRFQCRGVEATEGEVTFNINWFGQHIYSILFNHIGEGFEKVYIDLDKISAPSDPIHNSKKLKLSIQESCEPEVLQKLIDAREKVKAVGSEAFVKTTTELEKIGEEKPKEKINKEIKPGDKKGLEKAELNDEKLDKTDAAKTTKSKEDPRNTLKKSAEKKASSEKSTEGVIFSNSPEFTEVKQLALDILKKLEGIESGGIRVNKDQLAQIEINLSKLLVQLKEGKVSKERARLQVLDIYLEAILKHQYAKTHSLMTPNQSAYVRLVNLAGVDLDGSETQSKDRVVVKEGKIYIKTNRAQLQNSMGLKVASDATNLNSDIIIEIEPDKKGNTPTVVIKNCENIRDFRGSKEIAADIDLGFFQNRLNSFLGQSQWLALASISVADIDLVTTIGLDADRAEIDSFLNENLGKKQKEAIKKLAENVHLYENEFVFKNKEQLYQRHNAINGKLSEKFKELQNAKAIGNDQNVINDLEQKIEKLQLEALALVQEAIRRKLGNIKDGGKLQDLFSEGALEHIKTKGIKVNGINYRISEIEPAIKGTGAKPKITVEQIADALVEANMDLFKIFKGKRMYSGQIHASLAMLKGFITELPCGAGKTILGGATAYVYSLFGVGVHLSSAIEDLSIKDANEINSCLFYLTKNPKYISCLAANPYERNTTEYVEYIRKAYESPITYGTINEFVFDFLADSSLTSDAETPRQKNGLKFHIADEIDYALIQDALSDRMQSSEVKTRKYDAKVYLGAFLFAQKMEGKIWNKVEGEAEGYKLDIDVYEMENKLAELIRNANDPKEKGLLKAFQKSMMKEDHRIAEQQVSQSINAILNFSQEGEKWYLSDDRKSIIIKDVAAGAGKSGSKLQDGLQQAVEAFAILVKKHRDIEVTGETKTSGRIKTDVFARLYYRFVGMTGTASNTAGELSNSLGVGIIAFQAGKPNRIQRKQGPIYKDRDSLEKGLYKQVHSKRQKKGRTSPIMIPENDMKKQFRIARNLWIQEYQRLGSAEAYSKIKDFAEQFSVNNQTGGPNRTELDFDTFQKQMWNEVFKGNKLSRRHYVTINNSNYGLTQLIQSQEVDFNTFQKAFWLMTCGEELNKSQIEFVQSLISNDKIGINNFMSQVETEVPSVLNHNKTFRDAPISDIRISLLNHLPSADTVERMRIEGGFYNSIVIMNNRGGRGIDWILTEIRLHNSLFEEICNKTTMNKRDWKAVIADHDKKLAKGIAEANIKEILKQMENLIKPGYKCKTISDVESVVSTIKNSSQFSALGNEAKQEVLELIKQLEYIADFDKVTDFDLFSNRVLAARRGRLVKEIAMLLKQPLDEKVSLEELTTLQKKITKINDNDRIRLGELILEIEEHDIDKWGVGNIYQASSELRRKVIQEAEKRMQNGDSLNEKEVYLDVTREFIDGLDPNKEYTRARLAFVLAIKGRIIGETLVNRKLLENVLIKYDIKFKALKEALFFKKIINGDGLLVVEMTDKIDLDLDWKHIFPGRELTINEKKQIISELKNILRNEQLDNIYTENDIEKLLELKYDKKQPDLFDRITFVSEEEIKSIKDGTGVAAKFTTIIENLDQKVNADYFLSMVQTFKPDQWFSAVNEPMNGYTMITLDLSAISRDVYSQLIRRAGRAGDKAEIIQLLSLDAEVADKYGKVYGKGSNGNPLKVGDVLREVLEVYYKNTGTRGLLEGLPEEIDPKSAEGKLILDHLDDLVILAECMGREQRLQDLDLDKTLKDYYAWNIQSTTMLSRISQKVKDIKASSEAALLKHDPDMAKELTTLLTEFHRMNIFRYLNIYNNMPIGEMKNILSKLATLYRVPPVLIDNVFKKILGKEFSKGKALKLSDDYKNDIDSLKNKLFTELLETLKQERDLVIEIGPEYSLQSMHNIIIRLNAGHETMVLNTNLKNTLQELQKEYQEASEEYLSRHIDNELQRLFDRIQENIVTASPIFSLTSIESSTKAYFLGLNKPGVLLRRSKDGKFFVEIDPIRYGAGSDFKSLFKVLSGDDFKKYIKDKHQLSDADLNGLEFVFSQNSSVTITQEMLDVYKTDAKSIGLKIDGRPFEMMSMISNYAENTDLIYPEGYGVEKSENGKAYVVTIKGEKYDLATSEFNELKEICDKQLNNLEKVCSANGLDPKNPLHLGVVLRALDKASDPSVNMGGEYDVLISSKEQVPEHLKTFHDRIGKIKIILKDGAEFWLKKTTYKKILQNIENTEFKQIVISQMQSDLKISLEKAKQIFSSVKVQVDWQKAVATEDRHLGKVVFNSFQKLFKGSMESIASEKRIALSQSLPVIPKGMELDIQQQAALNEQIRNIQKDIDQLKISQNNNQKLLHELLKLESQIKTLSESLNRSQKLPALIKTVNEMLLTMQEQFPAAELRIDCVSDKKILKAAKTAGTLLKNIEMLKELDRLIASKQNAGDIEKVGIEEQILNLRSELLKIEGFSKAELEDKETTNKKRQELEKELDKNFTLLKKSTEFTAAMQLHKRRSAFIWYKYQQELEKEYQSGRLNPEKRLNSMLESRKPDYKKMSSVERDCWRRANNWKVSWEYSMLDSHNSRVKGDLAVGLGAHWVNGMVTGSLAELILGSYSLAMDDDATREEYFTNAYNNGLHWMIFESKMYGLNVAGMAGGDQVFRPPEYRMRMMGSSIAQSWKAMVTDPIAVVFGTELLIGAKQLNRAGYGGMVPQLVAKTGINLTSFYGGNAVADGIIAKMATTSGRGAFLNPLGEGLQRMHMIGLLAGIVLSSKITELVADTDHFRAFGASVDYCYSSGEYSGVALHTLVDGGIQAMPIAMTRKIILPSFNSGAAAGTAGYAKRIFDWAKKNRGLAMFTAIGLGTSYLAYREDFSSENIGVRDQAIQDMAWDLGKMSFTYGSYLSIPAIYSFGASLIAGGTATGPAAPSAWVVGGCVIAAGALADLTQRTFTEVNERSEDQIKNSFDRIIGEDEFNLVVRDSEEYNNVKEAKGALQKSYNPRIFEILFDDDYTLNNIFSFGQYKSLVKYIVKKFGPLNASIHNLSLKYLFRDLKIKSICIDKIYLFSPDMLLSIMNTVASARLAGETGELNIEVSDLNEEGMQFSNLGISSMFQIGIKEVPRYSKKQQVVIADYPGQEKSGLDIEKGIAQIIAPDKTIETKAVLQVDEFKSFLFDLDTHTGPRPLFFNLINILHRFGIFNIYLKNEKNNINGEKQAVLKELVDLLEQGRNILAINDYVSTFWSNQSERYHLLSELLIDCISSEFINEFAEKKGLTDKLKPKIQLDVADLQLVFVMGQAIQFSDLQNSKNLISLAKETTLKKEQVLKFKKTIQRNCKGIIKINKSTKVIEDFNLSPKMIFKDVSLNDLDEAQKKQVAQYVLHLVGQAFVFALANQTLPAFILKELVGFLKENDFLKNEIKHSSIYGYLLALFPNNKPIIAYGITKYLVDKSPSQDNLDALLFSLPVSSLDELRQKTKFSIIRDDDFVQSIKADINSLPIGHPNRAELLLIYREEKKDIKWKEYIKLKGWKEERSEVKPYSPYINRTDGGLKYFTIGSIEQSRRARFDYLKLLLRKGIIGEIDLKDVVFGPAIISNDYEAFKSLEIGLLKEETFSQNIKAIVWDESGTQKLNNNTKISAWLNKQVLLIDQHIEKYYQASKSKPHIMGKYYIQNGSIFTKKDIEIQYFVENSAKCGISPSKIERWGLQYEKEKRAQIQTIINDIWSNPELYIAGVGRYQTVFLKYCKVKKIKDLKDFKTHVLSGYAFHSEFMKYVGQYDDYIKLSFFGLKLDELRYKQFLEQNRQPLRIDRDHFSSWLTSKNILSFGEDPVSRYPRSYNEIAGRPDVAETKPVDPKKLYLGIKKRMELLDKIALNHRSDGKSLSEITDGNSVIDLYSKISRIMQQLEKKPLLLEEDKKFLKILIEKLRGRLAFHPWSAIKLSLSLQQEFTMNCSLMLKAASFLGDDKKTEVLQIFNKQVLGQGIFNIAKEEHIRRNLLNSAFYIVQGLDDPMLMFKVINDFQLSILGKTASGDWASSFVNMVSADDDSYSLRQFFVKRMVGNKNQPGLIDVLVNKYQKRISTLENNREDYNIVLNSLFKAVRSFDENSDLKLMPLISKLLEKAEKNKIKIGQILFVKMNENIYGRDLASDNLKTSLPVLTAASDILVNIYNTKDLEKDTRKEILGLLLAPITGYSWLVSSLIKTAAIIQKSGAYYDEYNRVVSEEITRPPERHSFYEVRANYLQSLFMIVKSDPTAVAFLIEKNILADLMSQYDKNETMASEKGLIQKIALVLLQKKMASIENLNEFKEMMITDDRPNAYSFFLLKQFRQIGNFNSPKFEYPFMTQMKKFLSGSKESYHDFKESIDAVMWFNTDKNIQSFKQLVADLYVSYIGRMKKQGDKFGGFDEGIIALIENTKKIKQLRVSLRKIDIHKTPEMGLSLVSQIRNKGGLFSVREEIGYIDAFIKGLKAKGIDYFLYTPEYLEKLPKERQDSLNQLKPGLEEIYKFENQKNKRQWDDFNESEKQKVRSLFEKIRPLINIIGASGGTVISPQVPRK